MSTDHESVGGEFVPPLWLESDARAGLGTPFLEYMREQNARHPHVPPTRRQRFRWWRSNKRYAIRHRIASWIIGYDIDESRDY